MNASTLVLDADQTMLAETAGDFVRSAAPLSRIRGLREAHHAHGYDGAIWARMAELGWTAIPFAESEGGLGMGLAEVVIVTEALGRALAPEPFLSSVMLAGRVLALAGNASQRDRWLAPLIAGRAVLALAHAEAQSRHERFDVATRAEPVDQGFRVRGEKTQVMDAHGAQAFVLSARTSGDRKAKDGLSLFLVPADTPGIEVRRQWRVDGRNAGIVRVDATLPKEALIGTLHAGSDVLHDVIEGATVALAGEMLGGMTEAFEQTLAYLKERRQFGVPIGSFQALKHRAARMFIEIELTRSLVMAAARAIDAGTEQAALLVSAAKARASDAYLQVANEAIQLHGGIGMTDEHDIGFFLKRARVAEMTFGDAAWHRDRFAALQAF